MARTNRFVALFGSRVSENFEDRLARWALGRVPKDQVEGFCSDVVLSILRQIRKRGAATIQHPEAYIFRVAHHLVQRHRHQSHAQRFAQRQLLHREKGKEEVHLLDALTGQTPHTSRSSESTLRLIHAAMENLPPRHREFLELDLGECLPPEVIRERMGIRSYSYFKKLKSLALKGLREEILRLVRGEEGK